MKKYFCDRCEKEVGEKDLKKFMEFNYTHPEKEFCEDCEKIYNESTEKIRGRCDIVKKKAVEQMDKIQEEEMNKIEVKNK